MLKNFQLLLDYLLSESKVLVFIKTNGVTQDFLKILMLLKFEYWIAISSKEENAIILENNIMFKEKCIFIHKIETKIGKQRIFFFILLMLFAVKHFICASKSIL